MLLRHSGSLKRLSGSVWAIAALLACVTQALFAPRALAVGPMPGVTSSSKFLIYYGNDFGTANMALMSDFDVVVLDPNVTNITPAVVATLQDAGVTVFAYISIGEDAGSTPILGNADGPVFYNGTSVQQVAGLTAEQKVASFYVDQQWVQYDEDNGEYVTDKSPDKNSSFHGYFVYPNGDWRWVINTQRIGGSVGLPSRTLFAGLEQIAGNRVSDTDTDRTHDFGFDGFFLDTLDTGGPYMNAYGYYPWAAQEMSNTVQFIRNTYSSKYILANRGLYFYHPGIVNPTYNIRPYDYTIRPYVDAILFESYYLDSSAGDPNESNNHTDNKYNYGPKVMAEANRADGFTVFCVDYQMNRGEPYYYNAVQETLVANGWTEYLSPDGGLAIVGTYVKNLLATNPPADSAAPVWDSTGSAPGFATQDVTDRIGVQQVVEGATQGDVIVRWDIARDQSGPVSYNIYRSTDPAFTNPTKYADVAFTIGDGWTTDPTTAYANQYTIAGLSNGTHYFRVRAQDSSASALEDTNTATLSITLGSAMATVSNPVSGSMTTDGLLTEWTSLDSFGADPDDISVGAMQADWREVWMAHDATYFYLGYQNDTTISIGWGFTVFLDTDTNGGTGFQGPAGEYPIGADYMIQGYSLYSYSGSGTDWSWTFVADCGRSWQGSTGELFFPRSWVGSPTAINLFFYGDNNAFGNAILDYYPDNVLSSSIGYFRYNAN